MHSAEAFEVTGVNRLRFNEAIAAGHYTYVPETEPGQSRQFPLVHLIALYCFQHHLDRGDPPRRAGEIASMIAEKLDSATRKGRGATPAELVVAVGLGGATEVHLSGALPSGAKVSGEPLLAQTVYSLENIETLLLERIADIPDFQPEANAKRRAALKKLARSKK